MKKNMQRTKQRPIRFNDEMMRAILEGRKTMTRRVVKVDGLQIAPSFTRVEYKPGLTCENSADRENGWLEIRDCPYGKVGKLLLIKGMSLEITNIRIERLQDITEKAAIAEGIERSSINNDLWKDYFGEWKGKKLKKRLPCYSPIFSYMTLWESIYGKESWEVNPWVWVIEFKRVEGGDND